MPTFSRAHHFVPRFLLAGFTSTGSKDGFLWAGDLETGKQWRTKPENVAHQRDFYRVDVPGIDPDLVENGLSKIEARAAEVIGRLLRTHVIPSGDEYLLLMNFVALMHVRIPSARESMNQSVDVLCTHLLRTDLRNKAAWEDRVKEGQENGLDLAEMPSYDYMKNGLEDRRYSFIAEQNWCLKTMLELTEQLTPIFAARQWALAVTKCDAFISSDCPVSVRFTKPKSAVDAPGLMREDTEITFPLSRDTLLIGSWDRFVSEKLRLSQVNVAFCNSIAAKRARRFLFSSARDFCWLDDKKNVRSEFGPLSTPSRKQ